MNEKVTGSRFKIHYNNTTLINNKKYTLVECLNDKTLFYKRSDTLGQENFKCITCRQISYLHKLVSNTKVDVSIVDATTSHVVFKCNRCNHIFMMTSSHLQTFRCENCVKLRYVDALKYKNCEYVDRYTKPGTSGSLVVKYRNELGELREVCASALLSGAWLPTNTWDRNQRKTYLYGFSFTTPDKQYMKIGISYNPELRLKSLQTFSECKIHILKVFNNYIDALVYEKAIHKYLVENKVPKDISTTFSGRKRRGNSLKKDGMTEWFGWDINVDMEKEVLNAIQINDCRISSSF